MEFNYTKRASFEKEKFKLKSEKPVIIKYNDKVTEDKQDNNVRLKSLTYELKTLKEMIKLRNKSDSLCEAFFSCGLSHNNKIIVDSENSLASCRHPECSILPSMKPEILNRFPLKTPNFDINSTVRIKILILDCFSMFPIWSQIMLFNGGFREFFNTFTQ